VQCRDASFTTASDNGNVVCSVSWIRMTDTWNACFLNCLYGKIIVVADVVLKYFLEYGLTAQLSLQTISLNQCVDTSGALFH